MSKGGSSPLDDFIEAENTDLALIELLLKKGANSNRMRESGYTPLYSAITKAHQEVRVCLTDEPPLPLVKLLLQYGAKPNMHSIEQIPLHLAILYMHCGIVEALLKSGAHVNTCDADGNTPLHRAMSENERAILKVLLTSNPDLNVVNKWGEVPLHNATDSEAVALLLAKGAHVDAKNSQGETHLHWAASSGDVQIAQLLLDAGADKNTVNHEGETALDLAKKGGHADLYKLLQPSNGGLVAPQISHEPLKNETPFDKVVRENNIRGVKDFIELKVDLNAAGGSGMTPLYHASLTGATDIVELLILSGANVNEPSENGDIALHVAGNAKIAELLINHRANINERNNQGETPAYCAVQMHLDKTAVLKVLLDSGADFSLGANFQGRTPLQVAVAMKFKECEKMLKKAASEKKKSLPKKSFFSRK